jgi:hypothetical protein
MNEDAPQNNQEEALQQILRGLPLETCEYTTDPETNEDGWHAPQGYIFRMSGRFTLQTDQSPTCMSHDMPLESTEMYIAEHQERYNELFIQTHGDKKQAFELLIENDSDLFGYTLPVTFEGKWLTADNSKWRYLNVREEVQPYVNDSFIGQIKNISPDKNKETPLIFSTKGMPQHTFVEWKQLYVQADLGFCTVELVPYEEPEPVLSIPDMKADDTTIQLPLGSTTNNESVMYIEAYEIRYGVKFTEAEKLDYIRWRRERGVPFADDPLRDFVFSDNLKILHVAESDPSQPKVLVTRDIYNHLTEKFPTGKFYFISIIHEKYFEILRLPRKT